MTGEEFQAALLTLNMTRAALSREVGVHRVTLQRYANGALPVPRLLQRYLELRAELMAGKNAPSRKF